MVLIPFFLISSSFRNHFCSSSVSLEPSLAPCWGFRAFKNDQDCSFFWSWCSLYEAFSSSAPALDTIWFKLKMIPVLVGKDLGKRKGNGHWKYGWKQRRLKGNLQAPGMGGGKKCMTHPCLKSPASAHWPQMLIASVTQKHVKSLGI